MPASSVLSEVRFSNTGELVSAKRASLTAERVWQLGFLYLNRKFIKPAVMGLTARDYRDALVHVYRKVEHKLWR